MLLNNSLNTNRVNANNNHKKTNVRKLVANCRSTGYIQQKLKGLFAGTIEQMLKTEMDEHLGYEKNSIAGNNLGNSRNGYGKKTISNEYGDCEIFVSHDRNEEFEPKVVGESVHQLHGKPA